MGPSVGMQWDLCAEFMGFWHYLIISGYGRGLLSKILNSTLPFLCCVQSQWQEPHTPVPCLQYFSFLIARIIYKMV